MLIAIVIIFMCMVGFIWGWGMHGLIAANHRRQRIFGARNNILTLRKSRLRLMSVDQARREL